jgi:hypothetical protein
MPLPPSRGPQEPISNTREASARTTGATLVEPQVHLQHPFHLSPAGGLNIACKSAIDLTFDPELDPLRELNWLLRCRMILRAEPFVLSVNFSCDGLTGFFASDLLVDNGTWP